MLEQFKVDNPLPSWASSGISFVVFLKKPKCMGEMLNLELSMKKN